MKYRTIVADPPWPIDDMPAWFREDRRSARERDLGTNPRPYDVMTLDTIAALPVRDLSDNLDHDAFLFLWTINEYVRESYDIARGWGFHPSALLTWCKPARPGGLGGVFPSNTEFVLYCRRPKVVTRMDVWNLTVALADQAEHLGISRADLDRHMGTTDMGGWWLSRVTHRCACPTDDQWPWIRRFLQLDDRFDEAVRDINARKGTGERPEMVRSDGRWFTWPIAGHSTKPEAFLDLVEQVSPGPYLELFARRQRLGWDTWGNECRCDVEMVGA